MTKQYLMAIASIDGPGYALVNRTVDGQVIQSGWTEDLYVENCEYVSPASALYFPEELDLAKYELESHYIERAPDARPYFRGWVEYTPAHFERACENTRFVEDFDEETDPNFSIKC